MLSTLRLFKSVPIEMHSPAAINPNFMKRCMSHGFIIDPLVCWAYQGRQEELFAQVKSLYGRSGTELNQAFHTSFGKVRDASIQQLVFEQCLHYLTTYGAESLGVTSEVYVPAEALNVPEITTGFTFTYITGMTRDELHEALFVLLDSGIALADQTLKDVMEVVRYVGVTASNLETIRNKEAKILLYRELDMVPIDPTEFLRYAVYLATGSTLLIKNAKTIEAITCGFSNELSLLWSKYEQEVGLQRLAEIFYRYKPLFLAFRKTPSTKRIINRIRRKAPSYHRPFTDDYLNTVTSRLAQGDTIDRTELGTALQKANIFRKIRLAYALRYRMTDSTSILYRIRSGRSWATSREATYNLDTLPVYMLVLDSIISSLSSLDQKKVYIPAGLSYGVPATEKQFTGNVPSGSFVELIDDMVCGIHWFNQGEERYARTDLDLSLVNATEKFGWDSYYRDTTQGIYFSGDQTSAPKPHGASEWYRIERPKTDTNWLFNVNYYNHDSNVPVPIKVIVGKANAITNNHVVDPNNVVAMTNTTITDNQKVLGIISGTKGSLRFTFAETDLGAGRTMKQTEHANHAREYLMQFYTNGLNLNNMLVQAGAILVDTPEAADIDLSLERVDKTTFIKLLTEPLTLVKK